MPRQKHGRRNELQSPPAAGTKKPELRDRTESGSTKKRQPRIYRQHHLTETEKMQLALRYALLPRRPNGTPIGVEKLEIRSMVAPGYISHHLDIGKLLGAKPDANPLQRQVRKDAGVPRKLTEDVQQAFADKASEWNWDFTFEEMEDELERAGIEISDSSLWRYCHAWRGGGHGSSRR